MGASLFIGWNDNGQRESNFQRTGGFVNGNYWDAFGDMLDGVFLPNHPKLHEIIKSEEGEYLKFYSFVELDKADFNRAVKLIRDYIAKQQNPTEWQNMAKVVWEDVAEPNIIQDARYDVNPE
ncbi:hypothetical protein [Pantoea agglomerans]|uniref:hypothetical protein n=1 Tax=Enterobacter agglomerans TaxID=549 RepID=UPI00083DA79B|nr:hypothetical protein [Pantoea agglomerans]AOE41765.1 hypothetical protein BEE12_18990 [Pantoea agglomerans]NEG57596.1 hypothetical protein [Pantoea agglomerans]NEG97380.1 hypothetical protein [Pantoea agglomerans]NEH02848.1 hypothetical protein [Pantoea agglomerans]NEH13921.1 hypothetical protein [Pantoea agglomerans]